MTRGRGGLDNPKNDDVIYEQPLRMVKAMVVKEMETVIKDSEKN